MDKFNELLAKKNLEEDNVAKIKTEHKKLLVDIYEYVFVIIGCSSGYTDTIDGYYTTYKACKEALSIVQSTHKTWDFRIEAREPNEFMIDKIDAPTVFKPY